MEGRAGFFSRLKAESMMELGYCRCCGFLFRWWRFGRIFAAVDDDFGGAFAHSGQLFFSRLVIGVITSGQIFLHFEQVRLLGAEAATDAADLAD